MNDCTPTGTDFVATFGARPVDVGPFRCHCCSALLKESFTPWRGYAERTRCPKCGTAHVFTTNEYACKVEYYASPKGLRLSERQVLADRLPPGIEREAHRGLSRRPG